MTKTVAVTIKDNDTAGLTVRDKVEVPEGSDKKMDVVLSAAPSADVTVTISGHAGTDLTPSPTSLTFTPANWNTDQPVMLTAVQDNDFVDDLVNLTLTANGGGYVDLVKTVALTIVDDDAPSDVMLRLKASPDRVEEGNMVTLTATLSSALPAAVTVSLTATPGDPPTEPNDYGPLPEITITGGERRGTGTIRIINDEVSEGAERFTVAVQSLPPGVRGSTPVEITIRDN
ncbi:MAG: hypothetical protein F4Z62_06810, partial [Rhodothermaceae bacterium]|nr:hypothetical protein [Rhodothermaceae bacterium]